MIILATLLSLLLPTHLTYIDDGNNNDVKVDNISLPTLLINSFAETFATKV